MSQKTALLSKIRDFIAPSYSTLGLICFSVIFFSPPQVISPPTSYFISYNLFPISSKYIHTYPFIPTLSLSSHSHISTMFLQFIPYLIKIYPHLPLHSNHSIFISFSHIYDVPTIYSLPHQNISTPTLTFQSFHFHLTLTYLRYSPSQRF